MAKGTGLGDLSGAAWSIGVTGAFVAMFVYLIVKIKENLGSNNTTVNATFDATTGALGDFGDWLPIIVVVIITFLILGYFYVRGR